MLKGNWHRTVELEGTKEKGFSHIYRNSETLKELSLSPVEGVSSLKEIYLDLFLKKYPNRKFLGKKLLSKAVSKSTLCRRTDRSSRKEAFRMCSLTERDSISQLVWPRLSLGTNWFTKRQLRDWSWLEFTRGTDNNSIWATSPASSTV